MKKKISILLSTLLVLCTFFSITFIPANAISYKSGVKLKSNSALLINLDTGQTVFEKKADKKRYPASTTKIMTYIVVAEHVDNFKKTMVEIKQDVLDVLYGTGSSVANISAHVGEKMTVLDLLYSMMVPSGNDAAVVLADYVGGGSIDKFVSMMNEKAKELGCKNTHFKNPDGLHDDDHYTTATDLAIMTQYALTLPEFSKITNTTTYYVEGDDFPLVTTNYLIDANRGGSYYYQYAQGVKTGTTDEAGHCLVTIGSADGYSYLGVFLDSPYDPDPYKDEYGTMIDAKELFRWSLTSLELNQVASSETPICEEKINLAWGKNSVQLVPEKNINAIVPKTFEDSDIKIEMDIPDSVDAPIKEGEVIGKATVYYDGSKVKEKTKLAEVNLVSSETVERSGILYVLSVIQSIIVSKWFIVVIAAIVVLLIIYIIISSIIKRRNRRNRRHVRRYRNF
ncbi:MAG: D-alanyl-D-alanine carboxypeptidase [Ruminococcus sp.]|nr:D-alanyl-D-alanine carboxypeptidase [Ruminococcus sp.]